MNWQENPHLFANEKFGAIHPDIDKSFYKIFPIQVQFNEYISFEPKNPQWEYEQKQAKDCTLLARPIADMSDEEISGFPMFDEMIDAVTDHYKERFRKSLSNKAEAGVLLMEEALCMASSGVYFGPQSHFETGEVLNINEVTV